MPDRRMTDARVIVVVALTAMLVHAVAAGQKSASTSQNWPCVITFDGLLTYQDSAGTAHTMPTAIQGDGKGPYVNGKEGVECYVNEGVTSAHYGNLFVSVDRASARYLLFPGQAAVTAYSRTGYATFQNRQPGYFEITKLDTAIGGTFRRRIRVGVGGSSQFALGEMWGNSLATDALTAGSSSAWVTSLDNCSWKLAWYPSAPLEDGENVYVSPRILALREGPSRDRTRTADFSMPLSATVTITGVKAGCGTAQ